MPTKKRHETAIIVRREAKKDTGKTKQKSAPKNRKKSDSTKNRHNTAFVVGSVIGGLAGAGAALWKTPYSGDELREKITGGSKSSDTSGETVQVQAPARPQRSVQDRVRSTVTDKLVPLVRINRSGTASDGDLETTTATARPRQQSIQSRILSTVENRLAPIVGVKLGQTANNNESASTTTARTTTTTTSSVGVASGSSTPTSTMSSSNGREEAGAPPAFPDEEPLGDRNDAAASAGAGENVTPVDQEGGEPSGMSSPVEPVPEANAASVDELTKPQIDLQPDALQTNNTDMHPFPKLGGKRLGGNRKS